MSNPIVTARQECAAVRAEIDVLESKHSFLKGWGTGWKPSHYGMADAEWDAIHAQHTELRRRWLALGKEIVRLKKVANPRGRTTLQAHR